MIESHGISRLRNADPWLPRRETSDPGLFRNRAIGTSTSSGLVVTSHARFQNSDGRNNDFLLHKTNICGYEVAQRFRMGLSISYQSMYVKQKVLRWWCDGHHGDTRPVSLGRLLQVTIERSPTLINHLSNLDFQLPAVQGVRVGARHEQGRGECYVLHRLQRPAECETADPRWRCPVSARWSTSVKPQLPNESTKEGAPGTR